MKIAILGGAGVRVPLLVGGLAQSDLAVSRIALHDTDPARLRIVADLASRVAGSAAVASTTTPEAAIEGADVVIASIRPGGAAARARDEAACVALGVVGQETVGPAGFAMAVRAIPPMVHYGRLVSRLAPRAWLVNFSNPVSLVTQAVHQETGTRVIGICDTPMEMFEDAAHVLGLPASTCAYDYFGLNHLGWLREVYFEGEPQLHRIWDDDAKLLGAYRSPLFEPGRLRALKLLPTEYLYYYYRPEVAIEWMRRAGSSRGAAVEALTTRLFADLASGVPDPVRRYRQYLADRDGSYMQIETGTRTVRVKPPWADLSGYDRIAVMTLRAIVHDQGAVIPLDVVNGSTFPFLETGDCVEVPCRVGRDGPRAEAVAPVPAHAREWMTRVKTYERATIAAALTGERRGLVDALALNPLVPSREVAGRLVTALIG